MFKGWGCQHAPLLKATSESSFSWDCEGAFGEEDKAQWDYQSWYKAHSQSSEGIEKREIRSGKTSVHCGDERRDRKDE